MPSKRQRVIIELLGKEEENFLSVSKKLNIDENSVHNSLTDFFQRFSKDLVIIDKNFEVFKNRLKKDSNLRTVFRRIDRKIKESR